MKKMIILTLVAGTMTHLQASSGPTPSFGTDAPTGYYTAPFPGQSESEQYTATAAQLAQVQPLIEAFSATTPQSVTIPADLVSVIQKVTYLAHISEQLGMLPFAYEQIQWGFNGPELQQAMRGNTNFTNLFNKYIALNQKIQQYDYESAQMTHAMQSPADINKVSDFFTKNVLQNRLNSNQMRTQLQTMFKQQNPDFETLVQEQMKTGNLIGQWVDTIMQAASEEKKQQVKDAVKTAVQNITTTPAAAKAAAAAAKPSSK